MVVLTRAFPDGNIPPISVPKFFSWKRDTSAVLSNVAAYDFIGPGVSLGDDGEPEQVKAIRVSADYFALFGVRPAMGRTFSVEEDRPGGPRAAVIGNGLWKRRFAADPHLVGRPVVLSGEAYTVVGVLSPGFEPYPPADVWLPLAADPSSLNQGHFLLCGGRLKPGVTLQAANARMKFAGEQFRRQYPNVMDRTESAGVVSMRELLVGGIRPMLLIMLGAVALVLLIGCANVANLLLARATARTREIAIRAAVGASRGRIVRQLITESTVLALIAGAAGLLLAKWGSDALVALAPGNVPRLAESGIDGWVLAFTLGISVAASLLFGLAPALQISRVDLNEALKQGATRAVGGKGGRMRAALVVVEVALSVVLLAGAGLLIRSFAALHNVALGFRPEHALVMESSVPASGLASARRATSFYKDLLADLATLPGVTAAGGTRNPPGTVFSEGSYFIGHLGKFDVNAPQAVFSVMTPHAFAALGIPLKRGRDFNEGDGYDAPFTAVINEALARKSFPGQDPLGRTIYCGFDSLKPMKIVGVVGDVRQYGPAVEPWPEIVMPYEQHPGSATALNIVVRASAAGSALWGPIQRKVRARSAEVPVKFTSMEDLLSENTAAPRFRTLLLGLFAAIAVCLAMAGVYGVVAYGVGQRAGEIGLRMALGARTSDVLRLILRQGMALTGIGLAAGLIAAGAATRLVASMLFEVQASDPATYIGVAALLGVVSLAASYIPARRAARVDPASALRQE
jgi:predicted permease